jgi:hypothetical protein
MPDLAALHPISRRHLEVLTGELGIMQHAIASRPDPAHGYCVDDVARALQVDLLHARTLGWAAVSESAWRAIRFLEAAFDSTTGRFRNFRSMDGAWLGGVGSDDSYGRAMLALGEATAMAIDATMRDVAGRLFDRALPAATRLTSPRAQASVVLGCAAVLDADSAGYLGATKAADTLRGLATTIHRSFEVRGTASWPWPEVTLTYENALLPRALIVAGRHLDSAAMVSAGLRTLDWLIDAQTSLDDDLSAVGNGWWPRGGRRSRFDQQPIEATSLLLAAEAAYAATGNPGYRAAMERSYAWFLGANDLGVPLADPVRGAGADGLTPSGINTNEGAESTIMWLMAAEHIRALRATQAKRAARRRVAREALLGSGAPEPDAGSRLASAPEAGEPLAPAAR